MKLHHKRGGMSPTGWQQVGWGEDLVLWFWKTEPWTCVPWLWSQFQNRYIPIDYSYIFGFLPAVVLQCEFGLCCVLRWTLVMFCDFGQIFMVSFFFLNHTSTVCIRHLAGQCHFPAIISKIIL